MVRVRLFVVAVLCLVLALSSAQNAFSLPKRVIVVTQAEVAVTRDGQVSAGEYDQDSADNKYDIFAQRSPFTPEAHLYVKNDGNWTYFAIDSPTDRGKSTKRELILDFDTKNLVRSHSPGMYCLELCFDSSPEKPKECRPISFHPPTLDKTYRRGSDYDWQYFFGPSPLGADPHAQFEIQIRTSILTNSSQSIGFHSFYYDGYQPKGNAFVFSNEDNPSAKDTGHLDEWVILQFYETETQSVQPYFSDYFTAAGLSARNRFNATDSAVCVWFQVHDLTKGSRYWLRYEWISPSNETRTMQFYDFTATGSTVSSLDFPSSGWACMDIAGHDPANRTGQWRLEVYHRQEATEWVRGFSATFTIEKPVETSTTTTGPAAELESLWRAPGLVLVMVAAGILVCLAVSLRFLGRRSNSRNQPQDRAGTGQSEI